MRSNAPNITPVAFGSTGSHPVECRFHGDLLPFPGPSVLYFDGSGGNPARTDDELIGKPNQVHRRELGARRFVAIVIKHLHPGAEELGIKVVSGAPAACVTRSKVDQASPERCHTFGPDDAGIV